LTYAIFSKANVTTGNNKQIWGNPGKVSFNFELMMYETARAVEPSDE
jgi:hypothetical protein